MKTHALYLVLFLFFLSLLQSCGGDPESCITLTLMSSKTQESGLTTVFFRVDCDGKPVEGLVDENFTVTENGQTVSTYESQLKIVSSNQEADGIFRAYTMLLLDMSGSIVGSDAFASLIQSAKNFVTRSVGESQYMGIFLFDGRAYIEAWVPFTNDAQTLQQGLDRLQNYQVMDRSTDLNGAVVDAIERLRFTLDHAEGTLLTQGILVIFTDGTDRAHRVLSLDAQEAVKSATMRGMSVYTIGLGAEIDEGELEALGKSGFVYARYAEAIFDAFAEIADKIENLNGGYYGLAYCSSTRNGTQELTIQVVYRNQMGTLTTAFDASHSGIDCHVEDSDLSEVPSP